MQKGTGIFQRGETFLPSVINVNDTNYFEETFVSRFIKDEALMETDILRAERIDNYNNFINEYKLQ